LREEQTAPLHLAIDPRIKDAEAALPKEFELSSEGSEPIGELHQAINEIRDVNTDPVFAQRFGAEERMNASDSAES